MQDIPAALLEMDQMAHPSAADQEEEEILLHQQDRTLHLMLVQEALVHMERTGQIPNPAQVGAEEAPAEDQSLSCMEAHLQIPEPYA